MLPEQFPIPNWRCFLILKVIYTTVQLISRWHNSSIEKKCSLHIEQCVPYYIGFIEPFQTTYCHSLFNIKQSTAACFSLETLSCQSLSPVNIQLLFNSTQHTASDFWFASNIEPISFCYKHPANPFFPLANNQPITFLLLTQQITFPLANILPVLTRRREWMSEVWVWVSRGRLGNTRRLSRSIPGINLNAAGALSNQEANKRCTKRTPKSQPNKKPTLPPPPSPQHLAMIYASGPGLGHIDSLACTTMQSVLQSATMTAAFYFTALHTPSAVSAQPTASPARSWVSHSMTRNSITFNVFNLCCMLGVLNYPHTLCSPGNWVSVSGNCTGFVDFVFRTSRYVPTEKCLSLYI